MSLSWSPVVSTLIPYVAGEQPASHDVVKLKTNEDP
jgi:histidinol-phosphate aminotransferase